MSAWNTMTAWTDRWASEMELKAALAFWAKYHSIGSRRRVRSAIRSYRLYH